MASYRTSSIIHYAYVANPDWLYCMLYHVLPDPGRLAYHVGTTLRGPLLKGILLGL